MAGKKGPNAKSVAGKDRKAENEAKKYAEEAKKREAAEAKDWDKGANLKKTEREDAAARKSDEAARRAKEKAELLAQEEAELASGTTTRKASAGVAKKKKKAKNELELLEDALQKAADKKVKKKKAEMIKTKQETDRPKEEPAPMDPLLANTHQMMGGDEAHEVGRRANKARMESEGTSGIEAALKGLNVKVSTSGTLAKSAKALYVEFEERTMPGIKADYPGLRLSQYKEKVWQLWKKSPDNPANQMPLPDATKL